MSREVITARDLSPFEDLTSEQEDWLRSLVKEVDCSTLTLSFNRAVELDAEPIAFFDAKSGQWWAGRFVGEIHYKDKSLQILPRYGMPTLMRWLSKIWGVRVLPSQGKHEKDRIWLWEVLARLWASRLVEAGKHGLPYIRVDEVYTGLSVRGRLKVKETAIKINTHSRTLVSSTRNRKINWAIAGYIIAAFTELKKQLRHIGKESLWLTERGAALIDQLQISVSREKILEAVRESRAIHYTPITEMYRPLVELSRSIIRRQPLSSKQSGSKKVFGVLLDMAEIWELYVYHVLRTGLTRALVEHTGRSNDKDNWLLLSTSSGSHMGRLKPDIIISDPKRNRYVIADAKYKKTSFSLDNQHGVRREDLYQMSAYLAAFESSKTISGFLIYPSHEDSLVTSYLEPKNPWTFTSRHDAQLSFVSLDTVYSDSTATNESERKLIDRVNSTFN